jgi:hypothetical protein
MLPAREEAAVSLTDVVELKNRSHGARVILTAALPEGTSGLELGWQVMCAGANRYVRDKFPVNPLLKLGTGNYFSLLFLRICEIGGKFENSGRLLRKVPVFFPVLENS